jgi:hypothetical protein
MNPAPFLKIFVCLLLVNSLVTEIHYALILFNIIPIRGAFERVWEFAIADTLATAIPSAIAAIGLLRLRTWGWIAALIACGGYLHGMASLLTNAATSGRITAMSFVSVYFIAFSLLTVAYLWRKRDLFA